MDNVEAAIGLIGSAGIASLFLPSLEKAWETEPGDPQVAMQMQTGTILYVAFLGSLGVLYGAQVGSVGPVLVAAGVTVLVVGLYRRAYVQRPKA